MVERRLGWEETRQARGVVVARAEVAVMMGEVAVLLPHAQGPVLRMERS